MKSIKREIICLAVLLIIGLSLCLYKINQIGDTHVDVYQIEAIYKMPMHELISDFFTPQGLFGGFQAPVYFVLAKLFFFLAPKNILFERLFSVIPFMLIIIFVFLQSKYFFKNNFCCRFLFSLTMAISPVFIWWATTAKYDMWLALFTVIFITYSYKFIDKPSLKSALISSIFAVLMIYTHYFGIIVFVAVAIIYFFQLLLLNFNKSFFKLVVIKCLAVFLLTLPLLTVVFRSIQERQKEGYHFTSKEKLFGQIIKANRELVVGYAISVDKGAFSFIKDMAEGKALRKYSLSQIFSYFIVSFSFLFFFCCLLLFFIINFHKFKRSTFLIKEFPLLVIFSVLAVSDFVHLSYRHSYFLAGSYCIYLVIWKLVYDTNNKLFKGIVPVSLLVFFVVSLCNYYTNINLKYPGRQLIVGYLKNLEGLKRVIVTDRLSHIRGVNLTKQFNQAEVIELGGNDDPKNLITGFTCLVDYGVEKNYSQIGLYLAKKFTSLEMEERSLYIYKNF